MDRKSCLIYNILRISSPAHLQLCLCIIHLISHTALQKKGECFRVKKKGVQSQCMYVSCKIMFNRPENENQNNWFLEVLRELSQHGVCSGGWKKVQVPVSNERIRDVQMNVVFACSDSSHVQISSRFESLLFAHFQSWSHTDLLS